MPLAARNSFEKGFVGLDLLKLLIILFYREGKKGHARKIPPFFKRAAPAPSAWGRSGAFL